MSSSQHFCSLFTCTMFIPYSCHMNFACYLFVSCTFCCCCFNTIMTHNLLQYHLIPLVWDINVPHLISCVFILFTVMFNDLFWTLYCTEYIYQQGSIVYRINHSIAHIFDLMFSKKVQHYFKLEKAINSKFTQISARPCGLLIILLYPIIIIYSHASPHIVCILLLITYKFLAYHLMHCAYQLDEKANSVSLAFQCKC